MHSSNPTVSPVGWIPYFLRRLFHASSYFLIFPTFFPPLMMSSPHAASRNEKSPGKTSSSFDKGPNQSILTILNSLLLLSNHIEIKTFFLSKPAPPLCSRFHPLPFHLFLSFLCTVSLFSANKHAPRSLIIKSTNHKTKLSLNPTYSSRHSPISLFPFI